MTLTIGELCAGYGGLSLGVGQVLDAEPVWFAENDAAASKVLTHRFPGLVNHGDLTTTDWATVEPVDIVTAGWPCQPWSVAGKKKGLEDDRAIWPAIADAIRILRPRLVVLENVALIAQLGELARACGDLAQAGYVGSWRCVRASDVRAPHKRERLFIAATDTTSPGGRHLRAWHLGDDSGEADAGGPPQPRRRGSAAPHPESHGRGERRPQPTVQRRDTSVGGDSSGAWGRYQPAISRWELILGRPAPAPTVLGARGGPQLSPQFVEFLMGLPEGWVTQVPGLSRTQQLKLLGNGVVPRQCGAAVRQLLPLLLGVPNASAA